MAEISPTSKQICSQCHALVASSTEACPACGAALLPYRDLDPGSASPSVVDHRGIVLPGRHAVGGVITPR